MHGLLRQTTSLSSRDRDRKLLRRNQMAVSASSKADAKGFLDKLFNKPQGVYPKIDVNNEISPMPPRAARGRDLRRTALIHVDSSDNESNDASMPNQKEKLSGDAFPPAASMLPDKRVSVARGRMRRTALINVESSDNESAESPLLNIQHRTSENAEGINPKGENTEGINPKGENTEGINDIGIVRRESNTSINSVNQITYANPDVFVSNGPNDDDIFVGSSDNFHASIDRNAVHNHMKPIFQMDRDDSQEEIFDTSRHNKVKEGCIRFESGSHKNLNELLFVNLDKLKTLSRSLDDRSIFGTTSNDDDIVQSSSRRNSMKLLTDCEQPDDKTQNEQELNKIRNHEHTNDVTEILFPKRRSLPIDRKQHSKLKKNDSGEHSDTKLVNSIISGPYENCRNEDNLKPICHNENGRNQKKNKLKKNVSLPVDVYTRENDDFTTDNFMASHGKLDTDPRTRKKFTRKIYLKNKIKSDGDFEEGDLLSPTSTIKLRSKRMRKESIV